MARARPIPDLDGRARAMAAAHAVLSVRVEELFACAAPARHPSDVIALHDLRIAGKRLRFSLLTLAPCLGPALPATLVDFEHLQDRLGAIHDLDVAADLVRDELRLALRHLRGARKQLDSHRGAAEPLIALAMAMAEELREGAAAGLLELLVRFAQRRRTLFAEFLVFWDGLLEDGLRARIEALAGAEGLPAPQ